MSDKYFERYKQEDMSGALLGTSTEARQRMDSLDCFKSFEVQRRMYIVKVKLVYLLIYN